MIALVLALIVGTLATPGITSRTESSDDNAIGVALTVATFPTGAVFTVGDLPGIDPAAADPWLTAVLGGWNAAAGRTVFQRTAGNDQNVTFDFDAADVCPPAASGCTDLELDTDGVITGCRIHLTPGASSYVGAHETGHCLGLSHEHTDGYTGVMIVPSPDNPSDRASLIAAGITDP